MTSLDLLLRQCTCADSLSEDLSLQLRTGNSTKTQQPTSVAWSLAIDSSSSAQCVSLNREYCRPDLWLADRGILRGFESLKGVPVPNPQVALLTSLLQNLQ